MNVREDTEGPTSRELRMTTFENLSLIAAYLNLIAHYIALALIYYGIRTMEKDEKIRDEKSKRRHAEFMAKSSRRHNEFMTDSHLRKEESDRRHAEARNRQEESMAALRALIERTR